MSIALLNMSKKTGKFQRTIIIKIEVVVLFVAATFMSLIITHQFVFTYGYFRDWSLFNSVKFLLNGPLGHYVI